MAYVCESFFYADVILTALGVMCRIGPDSETSDLVIYEKTKELVPALV